MRNKVKPYLISLNEWGSTKASSSITLQEYLNPNEALFVVMLLLWTDVIGSQKRWFLKSSSWWFMSTLCQRIMHWLQSKLQIQTVHHAVYFVAIYLFLIHAKIWNLCSLLKYEQMDLKYNFIYLFLDTPKS